jgi:hypothetical protein
VFEGLRSRRGDVHLCAFDLLELDGHDLRLAKALGDVKTSILGNSCDAVPYANKWASPPQHGPHHGAANKLARVTVAGRVRCHRSRRK